LVGDAEGEGFVVTALLDFDFAGGQQMETLKKIQEAFVLFVDTEDRAGITGVEFGEEDAALFTKLGEAAAERDAMRAGFVGCEAFQEQDFDFRGDRVLEALGFGVGFSPGETDDFGEKHLGELVTQHEVLGDFAAFFREKNCSAALNFDMAVAGHALDGSGDGRRSDGEFLGQAGADGSLIFLRHFPDGFEVVFLRDAGFFAAQRVSDLFRSRPAGQPASGRPARESWIRSPPKFSDKWRAVRHRDLRCARF
jgi:hypothetical protein